MHAYDGHNLVGPSERDSQVVPGQRASLAPGRQATLESNLANQECTPEKQATPDGTAGLGCTFLTTAARSASADGFPAAADGFPARKCAQAAEAAASLQTNFLQPQMDFLRENVHRQLRLSLAGGSLLVPLGLNCRRLAVS